jgi:2-polyprenyl-3-methyl-5-hydroxy-6-metoxy-1,4-benzoquinol methylase
MNSEFWDERYSEDNYVYGTEPNEFFAKQIDNLRPGKILMLGEGEGRNAVYAASKGWKVDAVDFSGKAREKALALAEEKGVSINYTLSKLEEFRPQDSYDAVGIIYIHLSKDVNKIVHKTASDALKTGGRILMQVYDKEQLGRSTGGPQNYDALFSVEEIENNFAGMIPEILMKKIIHVNEGKYHSGEAAVIDGVGIKP